MASDDPYSILGVERSAGEAEIRKAYRKLAKSLHPDLNPGDKASEERFKKVSQAYDILGDPAKRKRFDAGEIDGAGQDKPRGYYREYSEQARRGAAGGAGASAGGVFPDDLDAMLSELFGGRAGFGGGGSAGNGRGRPTRGEDQRYRLTIDLAEAVNGGTRRITMPDGRALDVKIPAAVREGQVLRLAGQGGAGRGGTPGDALIEIVYAPHAFFRRDGDDLRLDLPVTLNEAVLGAKVRVPVPEGAVMASVPKGSSSGRQLRLRGKGLPDGQGGRGDLVARLMIVLPEAPDAALEGFAAGWSGGPRSPRRDLGE